MEEEAGYIRPVEDNLIDLSERDIRYNGPEDEQWGLEALPSISKVWTPRSFTIYEFYSIPETLQQSIVNNTIQHFNVLACSLSPSLFQS